MTVRFSETGSARQSNECADSLERTYYSLSNEFPRTRVCTRATEWHRSGLSHDVTEPQEAGLCYHGILDRGVVDALRSAKPRTWGLMQTGAQASKYSKVILHLGFLWNTQTFALLTDESRSAAVFRTTPRERLA